MGGFSLGGSRSAKRLGKPSKEEKDIHKSLGEGAVKPITYGKRGVNKLIGLGSVWTSSSIRTGTSAGKVMAKKEIYNFGGQRSIKAS